MFSLMIFLFILNNDSGQADYSARCAVVDSSYTACVTGEALVQAKKRGPEKALNDLEEYFEKVPYKIDCHLAYHSVGAAFYREFGDAAYVENINGCYGAYYHGIVLETSTKYEGAVEDYADVMMNFCSTFNDLNLLYCIHGIGHGAYYVTGKDHVKSEEICKQTRRGIDCGAGLFMEIVKDESKANEFGMQSFQNFQVENCTIFTTDILYTSCHLMTHFGINIDQGIAVDKVCSYGDEKENNQCRLYYGSAFTLSILEHSPNYEQEALRENHTKIFKRCIEDSSCFEGWLAAAYTLTGSPKTAQNYCKTLVGRYGTSKNLSECTSNKIPIRFS